VLALRCSKEPTLVQDLDEPSRKPGEALIRMRVAGVCDTDLQLANGYMGFSGVLGHEFVGEVLESDDPAWCGRRVVADINAGCGRCTDCIHSRGHHCKARTVLGIVGRDGAMAERFTIPERCLVAVPDEVHDERAVFAEPLAAALHVADDVPSGLDRVLVLGDGKASSSRSLSCRRGSA
jgi:alcohol dehydrogenase